MDHELASVVNDLSRSSFMNNFGPRGINVSRAEKPIYEMTSSYVLAGRVTDASIAIAQAVEAERLGFRPVWICECFHTRECGVLFGAIAARTTRLDVGTGAMTITARPPSSPPPSA
jgi:hypothetical protein